MKKTKTKAARPALLYPLSSSFSITPLKGKRVLFCYRETFAPHADLRDRLHNSKQVLLAHMPSAQWIHTETKKAVTIGIDVELSPREAADFVVGEYVAQSSLGLTTLGDLYRAVVQGIAVQHLHNMLSSRGVEVEAREQDGLNEHARPV